MYVSGTWFRAIKTQHLEGLTVPVRYGFAPSTRARARRRQCATMGVDRTPRDGGAEAAARYRQYEYKAVRVRVT